MSSEPADPPVAAPGLGAALELLWGLRDRPRRGPKPGLTIDRIVAAAIDVADREGLGALSMARVAQDLGFSTMSLYRYVPTKADLLVLMVDGATDGPPDLRAEHGPDWRVALERWTRANIASMVKHPWIMQVAITGPPLAPKQLAWMEAALDVLEDTPLEPGDRIRVLQVLLVQSLGEARLAIDLTAAEQQVQAQVEAGAELPTYARVLEQLTSSERHPALRAIVAAGVFDQGTGYDDADLAFGLSVVLDGVEQLIERRRQEQRPPRRTSTSRKPPARATRAPASSRRTRPARTELDR